MKLFNKLFGKESGEADKTVAPVSEARAAVDTVQGHVGDIFSFFNEQLGVYNAVQIVGYVEDRPVPSPSTVLLDWAEERQPEAEDFPGLKPFRKTYYNYGGKPEYVYVTLGRRPRDYIFRGKHPPVFSAWRNSMRSALTR